MSPLGTTRCIPQAKFPQKPYNKSFIDQVCSVKMAGYWPRSFCELMGLDFVSVHKYAKKELGQYPAILTSHLVNNPYLYHVLQIWQANVWFLGRFYSGLSPFFYILGAFLIKQLFHSRLLDMRWLYPTCAHGIIVNYWTRLSNSNVVIC